MSPLLKWTLAIIGGGGIAAAIQALTGVTRITSSTTTGGLGNPIVSSVELGSSVTLASLAVLFPVIAGIIVIALLIWAVKTLIKKFTAKPKINDFQS